MRRGGQRGRLLAVLGFVAAIAAAVTFVRWSGARDGAGIDPDPEGGLALAAAQDAAPEAGAMRADLAPASPDGTALPAGSAGAVRSELAPAGTSVFGTLQVSGELADHWPMVLEQPEEKPVYFAPGAGVPQIALSTGPTLPRPNRLRRTSTDARGAFEFEDVEPGSYRVWPEGAAFAARDVVVVRGERCRVDIALDGTMFSGRFLHGGRPAHAVSLELQSLEHAANVYAPVFDRRRFSTSRGDVTPFLDGASFRMLVPPGRYRALLTDGLWPQAAQHEVPIEIPVGATRIERDFEIPGTEVTVVVRDETGAPLHRCSVCFDGETEGGRRALRVFEGGNGQVVVERVPPGAWRVGVGSPDAQETPPRAFTTSAAIPRDRIEFVVQRGCEVRLTMRLPDGAPRAFAVELLPVLRSGDRRFPCVLLGGEAGTRSQVVGYRGVPPGKATLELVDRDDGGQLHCLPFEPIAPASIDVVAGGANEFVLDVLPRAFVDLRACEAGGREQVSATLSLFAGERRVHGLAAERNRWRGWLPQGDYRVTIDRAGAVREHDLRVDRRDITMRYRP